MSYTVTVVVAAEPAAVWSRLADIANWPVWNPACIGAEVEAPHHSGQRLRLQMLLPRGRPFWTAPRLTELASPSRIAWETRALGMRAPTTIGLEPHDAGTAVTLTSSSRGPLAFTYRLTFPEKTQAQMWSGALTGLARSFDGDGSSTADATSSPHDRHGTEEPSATPRPASRRPGSRADHRRP